MKTLLIVVGVALIAACGGAVYFLAVERTDDQIASSERTNEETGANNEETADALVESRNQQRTNETSFIIAAINECLANNRGQMSECDSTEKVSAASSYLNRLSIFKRVSFTDSEFPDNTETANVVTGAICDEGGTDVAFVDSERSFVVLYQEEAAEGSIERCVY